MIQVLDDSYLGITALATFAMQMSFFAIAFGCEFDKVTDIAVSGALSSLRHDTDHTRRAR